MSDSDLVWIAGRHIKIGYLYRATVNGHRVQVVYLRTAPGVYVRRRAWLDPWPMYPGAVTWPARRRRRRRR